MNVITVKELEERFDEILDDVSINKKHYRIQLENGNACMLIPIEDYSVFQDVYEDWVGQPENTEIEGFDPKPLPVTYLGEAEPEMLS